MSRFLPPVFCPFDIAIIDHGADGHVSMGDGLDNIAGKYIDDESDAEESLFEYFDSMRPLPDLANVNSVSFIQCKVAQTAAVGREFLLDLALQTGATHGGYDNDVWAASNLSRGEFYLFVRPGTKWWTAKMDGTIYSEAP